MDSTKTIYDETSGSRLKVLSSEAYSKHGYKPSCVIFDELHAQPSRDLWDVMTFGAGDARRQPVWIVLTTAGDDPDRKSIGWEVHEKALAIYRWRRGARDEKAYDDPRWLPIIYGLGLIEDEDELKDLNIYDEDLWRRCNPSLGKTLKMATIRAQAADAKKSEAAERLFRWLRLNQWIATATVGWIPITIYDKRSGIRPAVKTGARPCSCCAARPATAALTSPRAPTLPPSSSCSRRRRVWTGGWLCLPGGCRLTALTHASARMHVPYRDWIRAGFLHGCEGDIIDFEAVADAVVQAAQDYDLRMVGFDPYLGATVMQTSASGLPVR